MARIGYARVSTIDQDADIQIGKLKAEGCELIRAEKVSGASRAGRVELETIIQFLRPGDELVVTRLDQLGATHVMFSISCMNASSAGPISRYLIPMFPREERWGMSS